LLSAFACLGGGSAELAGLLACARAGIVEVAGVEAVAQKRVSLAGGEAGVDRCLEPA
jgi:hypothetical protein